MKIDVKIKASFSFYKLSKFINSKNYMNLKNKATFSPFATHYKEFIRKGRVKDKLKKVTIDSRRKRKSPTSIGVNKPLYDTGKLVQSIRYDEKDKSIKGIDYAAYQIQGIPSKNVPPRDFIQQANDKMSDAKFINLQRKGILQLGQVIRRVFRRKLAK
jgi:hypothetical protein